MKTKLITLLKKAKDAGEMAYAPYSKYRVGAAVLTDSGVFTGFNIENASSPLGICAEKAAITNALVNGAKNISAIAVYCLDASEDDGALGETLPCGSCRQWIAELAPDAKIITNGSAKVFVLDDLLPNPFLLRK